MPGSTPPTSQLEWLSSTTAMIVLFWSRTTRDRLRSFGWGIAALHRENTATKLPFLTARPIASLGPRRRYATPCPPASTYRACNFGAKSRRVQLDLFCAADHPLEPGACTIWVGCRRLAAYYDATIGRNDPTNLIQDSILLGPRVFTHLIERFVHFLLVGNPPREFGSYLATTFSWHRFWAVSLWIFVLFLIYVTASEFSHLFGPGEMRRLLFPCGPWELHLNRRQRIRELLRLSRLADADSIADFRDPTSPEHDQLVDVLQRLARDNQLRTKTRIR